MTLKNPAPSTAASFFFEEVELAEVADELETWLV